MIGSTSTVVVSDIPLQQTGEPCDGDGAAALFFQSGQSPFAARTSLPFCDEGLMLDDLRQRPALYIGAKTLTGLYHFLGGYQFARIEHNVADNALSLPGDFHDWVAYRLHFNQPTSGWHSMILSKTSIESDAFDQFFALLDEHSARVPCVRAKLRGIRRSYTATTNGVSRQMYYPDTISLVTYTDDPGFFVYSDDTSLAFPRHPFFPSIEWLTNWLDVGRADFDSVDANWPELQ